jgi:hypothetical protein
MAIAIKENPSPTRLRCRSRRAFSPAWYVSAAILKPSLAGFCTAPAWKADGGIAVTASHNPPEYNGIKQGNRNTLLAKNIGVDGLKTGHIEESGYHLGTPG